MSRTHNIRKILIANRGEIAGRIIRTCRKMSISTVAVYSVPDASLDYVRSADEAVSLEGTTTGETYLDGDKIISAALLTGADAIHPGYGFLSENAEFARKVLEKGLIFIGPSVESIEAMGHKIRAKKLAEKANVPLIPGGASPVENTTAALREAEEIGYPVLLKAAAGGGGKGMRTVHNPKEMKASFDLVKSEARSFFGDDAVFVEKYIVHPKHVEIQIFGDQEGNLVHLYERDCSIQRRHQKIAEEGPCATIRENTRERMTAAALRLARQVRYYSSGTVEFLMDKNQNFYFLEMNTRLQVEHPVTEMITGTDLVEWQILVADGQPLPLLQEELSMEGHAIELRIYAEEYLNGFSPSPGRITRMNLPPLDGIRLDMGFTAGDEVTLYYDPMIGKIICKGDSREDCIRILESWLRQSFIAGVETTLPFGQVILKHPLFRSGEYSILFNENLEPDCLEQLEKSVSEAAAYFVKHLWEDEKEKKYLLGR